MSAQRRVFGKLGHVIVGFLVGACIGFFAAELSHDPSEAVQRLKRGLSLGYWDEEPKMSEEQSLRQAKLLREQVANDPAAAFASNPEAVLALLDMLAEATREEGPMRMMRGADRAGREAALMGGPPDWLRGGDIPVAALLAAEGSQRAGAARQAMEQDALARIAGP